MKYLFSIMFLALSMICLVAPAVADEEVVFGFQGRVKSGGQHHAGPGYFKLAIIVKEGSDNYVAWVNSGPIGLGEPTEAITVDVNNGHFNIPVGDISLANMAALPSVIFNTNRPMFMRVWFSDGSGFEQLSPDSPIHNPRLFVREQTNLLDLYVDASVGNDNWPGIHPDKPKKTIQAAVDALPAVITKPSTIHIADGRYFERVQLRNITMGGAEGSLLVQGNTASPELVVISARPEPEAPAELLHGFLIHNSNAVTIKGVTAEGALNNAFSMRNSSVVLNEVVARDATHGMGFYRVDATLQNVLVTNCERGLRMDASEVFMYDSEISNITEFEGAHVLKGSFMAHRSLFTGTAWAGVSGTQRAYIGLWDCVIDNCSNPAKLTWEMYALHLEDNSLGKLYGTTVKNSGIGGVLAARNSYVEFRRHSVTTNRSIVQNNQRGIRAEKLSGMESQDGDRLNLSGNILFNYQKDASSAFISIS